MSRIGKMPVKVPKGVNVTAEGTTELRLSLPKLTIIR